MVIKKITAWVVIAAMIFTMCSFVPQSAKASTSNTIGGLAVNGCLKVSVTDGNIYVERYSGSAWVKQYYEASDTVLNAGGTIYETGTYYGTWAQKSAAANQNITKISVASQTVNDKSIITTWVQGALQITQTLTLPSQTAQYIKMVWAVKNAGSTSLNNLHFLRGEDTYLGGDDSGYCYWDQATHSVGVYNTIDGVLMRLYLQGVTAPNSYTSEKYGEAVVEVSKGLALSKTIAAGKLDNAYAMEWERDTLAAGETWTIRAVESFVNSPVTGACTANTVVSPTDGTVTVPYTITNSSSTTQNVTYSVEGPEGWGVTSERTSDTLAAGQSTTINVQVTIPEGAATGDYEVVLNTASSGYEAQSVGIVSIVNPPEAPSVTADDDNNILTGADSTMEYSTDGGSTWRTYDESHAPVFDGAVTVTVRVKETETTLAGNITTVSFTKNTPAAPSVTADDDNNILTGADSTMEYSTNGGSTWRTYDESHAPVFDGAVTVTVRVKETETTLAGNITTISFTKNTPAAPSVTADDDNNILTGADSTMEYSTDGGSTWRTYDESHAPVFDGAVTVTVRVKETETTLAGNITTVSFTKNTPAAPSVTADDDNNILTGADSTMEYSTDGGSTWRTYDESHAPVFDGAVTVTVRVKETETTLAGNITTVSFTKNTPAAPSVTADDDNNILTGADSTMEYSTNGGSTWRTYDESHAPVFDGAVTVTVRVKETETTLAGNITTISFTKNTPAAPSVTADDDNNILTGADSTMECSTDGGSTWRTYDESHAPVFDGAVTVTVRVKETETTLAGNITTVSFTKNTPAAPSVTADDDNNILTGADSTMEYSTNGGSTWRTYDESHAPVFDGAVTVTVRVKETETTLAGNITTVSFTKNTPAAPSVTADDDNNILTGADSTMEYSTDGGSTWRTYDESHAPVFDGAVTVTVRVKETETTLAGNITTVSFTKNTPAAPSVTADDDNNILTGADSTMEYSTDGGSTWRTYDESHAPVFDGAVTVTVRVKETETTLAGNITTVSFTKNTPAAPSVTADDDNNILTGADSTMEYSTDGGSTWRTYDESHAPVFDGAVTVTVRVKETETTLAGNITTVSFTKNPQAAPTVITDDVNNRLTGLDGTMEYSTDGGSAWTTYDSSSEPVFNGNVTVLIRKKETSNYAMGDVTTVRFTENPQVPGAPQIISDDSSNEITGLDSTMEYSTDGGTTWQSYDDNNQPVFKGGVSVQLRKKAGEAIVIDYSGKTVTGTAISTVSGTAISAVSGTAVSVVTGGALTVDFTNNKVGGTDGTMEYSKDGGMTWNSIQNSILDFDDSTTVLIRKKAGEITAVTFTKNSQAAPTVTADDVNNRLTGLDGTMEYSTDGGSAWTTYDSSSEPVFNGNVTVLIRKKETSDYVVGDVTTVRFTENPQVPGAPQIISDDSSNEITGLDSTMEYSTDGGTTWQSYDDNNQPVFKGGVSVQLRKKAGEAIVIDYSGKTVTGTAISTVSGTAISAVSGTAVSVVTGGALTIDFTNNKVGGTDGTMEYSKDGGMTWNSIQNSILDFDDSTTVLIRKKAGEITAVTFTKNSQAAPTVTADDVNNRLTGLDSTMEYSMDGGSVWTTYDSSSEPVFNGNVTILIRKKETSDYAAGDIITVSFTEYAVTPVTPSIPTESDTGSTQTVRQINVNSGNETETSTVATIDIVRTVDDELKVDSVVLDRDKTKEALSKKENSEFVQIVMDDIPEDRADEQTVTINKDAVKELAGSNEAIEIKTEEVSIRLPKESISDLAGEEKDLYFRIVPILDEAKRSEVIENVARAEVVLQTAGNDNVQILGTPMTIETNYKDFTTKLVFSLKDISLPEDETARKKFLNSLAVYIHHSDGDKEVNRGSVVYDENGIPTGLEIEISKFSVFTIISISNQAPAATDLFITGQAAVGKKLTAGYCYSDQEGDPQGDSIIKWYRADSKNGKNKTLIKGADDAAYKVTKADQNKYLIVEMTPVAKTGERTGTAQTIFVKVAAYNEEPKAKSVNIKGSMLTGATLTASYTYTDAEKNEEGKSEYQWYRSDDASGKNKQVIAGANKLTYTLTEKDLNKNITFEVKPIAESGSRTGNKASNTTKMAVQSKYDCHVRLGLIGSGTYAKKVAEIFNKNYDVSNVRVETEGRYYRVYFDFTSKTAARAACKKMIAKEYIINYYFIN